MTQEKNGSSNAGACPAITVALPTSLQVVHWLTTRAIVRVQGDSAASNRDAACTAAREPDS